MILVYFLDIFTTFNDNENGGEVLAVLFTCTGRKKAVHKLVAHFHQLEKDKKITIMTVKTATKRAAIWKYDEAKILFVSTYDRLSLDKKLLKGLDYASMKEKNSIAVKMSTFHREDDWLKGNIITLTAPFQMRGGHLSIREEVEKTRRHTRRICHMVLSGPRALTTTFTDLLVEKKLGDPSTLEYMI